MWLNAGIIPRIENAIDNGEGSTMKQNRLHLLDILGGRTCTKCGYSEDTRALTFHHVRDDGLEDRKIHSSSFSFYSFYSKNPELAKANLQVLCCNCNAIEKYNTMGFKI